MDKLPVQPSRDAGRAIIGLLDGAGPLSLGVRRQSPDLAGRFRECHDILLDTCKQRARILPVIEPKGLSDGSTQTSEQAHRARDPVRRVAWLAGGTLERACMGVFALPAEHSRGMHHRRLVDTEKP